MSLYVPAGNVMAAPAPDVRFASITDARSVQVPAAVWQMPLPGLSSTLSSSGLSTVNEIVAKALVASSKLPASATANTQIREARIDIEFSPHSLVQATSRRHAEIQKIGRRNAAFAVYSGFAGLPLAADV